MIQQLQNNKIVVNSLPDFLYFITKIKVLHQSCSLFPSSNAKLYTTRKRNKLLTILLTFYSAYLMLINFLLTVHEYKCYVFINIMYIYVIFSCFSTPSFPGLLAPHFSFELEYASYHSSFSCLCPLHKNLTHKKSFGNIPRLLLNVP